MPLICTAASTEVVGFESIINVSKDRKILYHIGNDGEDTEGCVLPGSIKGSGVVYDSKKKFDELRIFITGNGVLDVKTIINNKIKK